jgi:hypothetical protein
MNERTGTRKGRRDRRKGRMGRPLPHSIITPLKQGMKLGLNPSGGTVWNNKLPPM